MMRLFGNLSISLKLRLIIIATSSIALLLACAAFVAYDQVATRRWLASDLTSQTKMVANSVTAAIAFNDRRFRRRHSFITPRGSGNRTRLHP